MRKQCRKMFPCCDDAGATLQSAEASARPTRRNENGVDERLTRLVDRERSGKAKTLAVGTDNERR
jgi:hypothetical protein